MSAVPKTDALQALPNALENLVPMWIEAKRQEDAAKQHRLQIEERIFAVQPAKEEGSTTVEAAGYKVTLTGKLAYKADDLDALREITRTWDSSLVPIKTTHALDDTGCKYLRRERPELWTQLARVITVSPAKTGIKVGV
jgi:hypothetical protein